MRQSDCLALMVNGHTDPCAQDWRGSAAECVCVQESKGLMLRCLTGDRKAMCRTQGQAFVLVWRARIKLLEPLEKRRKY